MTTFVDIYQDLPSRVSAVWELFKSMEQKEDPRDLSVTAMLMAAAAGLAMPQEHLKKGSNNPGKHPSFKGKSQDHYESVYNQCRTFLTQAISTLDVLKTISFMHCPEMANIRNAIEYGNNGETVFELSEHTLDCFVYVVRNALAHNNIVAFGDSKEEITKLGFFSESRGKSKCRCNEKGDYLVVAMSTCALQAFLKAWFEMLTKNNPTEIQRITT